MVQDVVKEKKKAFKRRERSGHLSEREECKIKRPLVPELIFQRVMLLYEDTKSRVKAGEEVSEGFPINVGVHQGSALSPLLFILIMEEATKECQAEAL